MVAVVGLGGLGHLGVQYAAKMGFKTVAIARGEDKEPLAKKLGAWKYIDSQATDPAAELAKLGGAKVILATVTVAEAMKSVIGGLAVNGTMMLIGAVPSLEVSPLFLLIGEPLRQRLVFGSLDGFPGHPRLQRAVRRALDERGLSARKSTGGLRADVERQSAVPRGAHDGKLTGH